MIFLIVLAVIILILLIPVSFLFDYSEELEIKLKYLFIKISLSKEKTKEKPSQTKKEEKNKTVQKVSLKEKTKQLLKEKGAVGFLNIIISLSKPVGKALAEFTKCLYIKDLDIYYKVGGKDAAKVATEYGKACSLIYPCANMFCSLAHINEPRITTDLDYSSEKSVAIASCKVTVIPLQILIFLVKNSVILIKKTKEVI